MNILLIGNGFDLAHGLPTSYADFLRFVEVIKQFITINNNEALQLMDWKEIHPELEEKIKQKLGNESNDFFLQKRIWKELLYDNIWVEYFLKNKIYIKENWIDFENEIAKVILSLDNDMKCDGGKRYELRNTVMDLSNEFLEEKYLQYHSMTALTADKCEATTTFGEIRDKLYEDLNKLVRGLEIYLAEYINCIECDKISPNIRNIDVDTILSFNYTETYARIYGLNKNIECDYIHGKADLNSSIVANNMVLGIDEYLSDERKNKDIEFIAFKKYYQRIYKQTGCKYKEWSDEIESDGIIEKLSLKEEFRDKMSFEDYINKNYLYIFGHSLDVTDKDVLKTLILKDNVYTTIYYHEKFDKNGNGDNGRNDLGQKIANLVKVIGQDELIKRTSGRTKTIEFKLQSTMQKR